LSSAACSIVLLYFYSSLSFFSASALLYCSALPLLCSIILFFYSVFHLLCLSFSPILIYNSFHSVYQSDFILNCSFLLSNCFVLFPFRTANPIQSRSFSFIHDSLTIPLPLPMGNPRTSVLATETLTNSSSSVRFT
jgi:hypothetical protein